MDLIDVYPRNKIKYVGLIKFFRNVISICEKSKIKLILYGSLAIFSYTKNKTMKINDIDFLVKEKDLEELISIFKLSKIKYKYSRKWHVIQIFNNKLKIEFDSIDFWQKDLDLRTNKLKFKGFKTNVLNKKSLEKVYLKAIKQSKNNKRKNKERLKLFRE